MDDEVHYTMNITRCVCCRHRHLFNTGVTLFVVCCSNTGTVLHMQSENLQHWAFSPV